MTRLLDETRYDVARAYLKCRNANRVAIKYHVHRKTVTHWADTYAETKRVRDRKGTGRKLVMTAGVLKQAVEHLMTQPNSSCETAARELYTSGLTGTLLKGNTDSKAIGMARKRGEEMPY